MYTELSGAEFIEKIRSLDERLNNVRLSSIEVKKEERALIYNFICDVAVDSDLKNRIWQVAESVSAPSFASVKVNVAKIASNPELINGEIVKFLKENFPSVSIFLKPTDVMSVNLGDTVKYTVRLTADGAEYMKRNGAYDKLNAHLERTFCSDFAGETVIKESEETVDLTSEEVFTGELKKIEARTIKVEDVVAIDDAAMGDTALYIEDFDYGEAVICGTVTDITERETKTGKPFFVIHLDDGTGSTGGIYFSKKNTYAKIKEIAAGDEIIARASIGDWQGKKSTTFLKINRCTFPKDFVKQDRFKKTAPKNYSLVFPTESTTISFKSVFDAEGGLPDEFIANEYVVFDLETTGTEVMNNGITEIGAVKIKNGRVSQQWTTLVKPDYPITEEITEITGITPEMVKDAPKISQVIPDFMKFIEGAILVAHNAEFDMKFLKRFAAAEEYDVNNKVLDTMIIARTAVPTLRRFDLHTLADHFGIVFHHHRALSDAYATAEAFMEMMRGK